MSSHLEIAEEYQRLVQLGEYSDAARVQLFILTKMGELAFRLEALEARLEPLAKAMDERS
jgi:hypothetical protein